MMKYPWNPLILKEPQMGILTKLSHAPCHWHSSWLLLTHKVWNLVATMYRSDWLTQWSVVDISRAIFCLKLKISDLADPRIHDKIRWIDHRENRVMKKMDEKVFRCNFFVWKYFFKRSKIPFVSCSKVTEKRENEVLTPKFSNWAQIFVWVVV